MRLQLGRSKPWLWGCHHTMPGHPEAQDGETPTPPPGSHTNQLPGKHVGCLIAWLHWSWCFQISQLSGRCWAFIWGLVEHGSRCLMTLLWHGAAAGIWDACPCRVKERKPPPCASPHRLLMVFLVQEGQEGQGKDLVNSRRDSG